jgi:hypothetical protein
VGLRRLVASAQSGIWQGEAIELAAGARGDTGQGRRVESCRGATFVADRGRLVQTDGLRLQDTATVLEVTFGRVQQLLKD